MKDRSPFGLAELWENWKDPSTGEWVRTFCVITTNANELVAEIHDRMPVILPPAAYDRWLGLEPDPRDLLKPFPAELMIMWPVSTRVNTPRNDDEDLIRAIEIADPQAPAAGPVHKANDPSAEARPINSEGGSDASRSTGDTEAVHFWKVRRCGQPVCLALLSVESAARIRALAAIDAEARRIRSRDWKAVQDRLDVPANDAESGARKSTSKDLTGPAHRSDPTASIVSIASAVSPPSTTASAASPPTATREFI
jgi:SOS response associated peptidase (SRAP)